MTTPDEAQALLPVTKEDEARFWAKVDKHGPDECWPWTGSTDGRYGQFWLNGKRVKANRLSLAMHSQEQSANWRACHTCDNPIRAAHQGAGEP